MLEVGLSYVGVGLLGYVLGSIPFGIIVTRLAKGVDIRLYGSGMTGTTNVMRTVGSKAGLITMLLDVAKGAAAVFAAWLVMHSYVAQAVSGVAAIVGHNWSIFIRFRGGRGVATYVGGLFGLYWPVGVGAAVVVLGIGALSRYMSLGSVLGIVGSLAAMAVLFVLDMQPGEYLAYAGVAAAVILMQHRGNITRLLKGTERKLSKVDGPENPSHPEESRIP